MRKAHTLIVNYLSGVSTINSYLQDILINGYELQEASQNDKNVEHPMEPPMLFTDCKQNRANGIADATQEQK